MSASGALAGWFAGPTFGMSSPLAAGPAVPISTSAGSPGARRTLVSDWSCRGSVRRPWRAIGFAAASRSSGVANSSTASGCSTWSSAPVGRPTAPPSPSSVPTSSAGQSGRQGEYSDPAGPYGPWRPDPFSDRPRAASCDSWLSEVHLPSTSASLSVHTDLLPVRRRGAWSPRRAARQLAGPSPTLPLPPVA